ncbi:hypothetical protein EGW08_005302 [Elysia chlorotica]|uniref:Uncharacterized protein n=1 Tax=Elysia chlorotica TaxID=188477 RepID=A0A433TZA5_ELYCH|nr:hypothetical protein EGW08_005302 [Elysia chlorotica]
MQKYYFKPFDGCVTDLCLNPKELESFKQKNKRTISLYIKLSFSVLSENHVTLYSFPSKRFHHSPPRRYTVSLQSAGSDLLCNERVCQQLVDWCSLCRVDGKELVENVLELCDLP